MRCCRVLALCQLQLLACRLWLQQPRNSPAPVLGSPGAGLVPSHPAGHLEGQSMQVRRRTPKHRLYGLLGEAPSTRSHHSALLFQAASTRCRKQSCSMRPGAPAGSPARGATQGCARALTGSAGAREGSRAQRGPKEALVWHSNQLKS